ncbi:MAG: TraB/GumN family protein [Bacteroidia bacterium]|nr:TraB/GumN family protein [Bacteroidia bacterium]
MAFSALNAQNDSTGRSNAKTIFFKIEHPGVDHSSYLFGTHHAFGKSFFDTLNNVNKALDSASIFIMENLNIPGKLAQDVINQRKSTTKWAKYLRKKDRTFVLDMFDSSGIDWHKMTPAELSVFLNRYYKERVCLDLIRDTTHFSLDDYIGTLAREQNKIVKGLETTAEQVELINKDVEGMPRKVHKKRLTKIIGLIRSGSRNNCDEISWYLNLNIDYQFNRPCSNTLLLTDRNKKWLPQLDEHMQEKSCFVAVGLSHLMFDCGIIRLLQQQGYTVTPVLVN